MDKLKAVKQICEERGISLRNVVYVVDDINDWALIQAVDFGCCVSDAREEVKASARYISKLPGGHGTVREIVKVVLGKNCTNCIKGCPMGIIKP